MTASVKTQKFRMQSVIYILSCCILIWFECLIFSCVFVVVANLILPTIVVSALLTDMKKQLFCKMDK